MAVHYAEPEIERMVSDVEQGMAPSCAPVNGTLLLPGLEDIAARRAPVPSFVVYGLDLSQLPSLYRALRERGYRYDTTRLPSGAHEIRVAPAQPC
jgi:hypothetical protein